VCEREGDTNMERGRGGESLQEREGGQEMELKENIGKEESQDI